MFKISAQIYSLIFNYNKSKSLFLIFFLVIATFVEGLSIAIIFPILEILINQNSENIINNLIPMIKSDGIDLILYSIIIISIIFFFKSLFMTFFAWWKTGYHKELNEHFRVMLLKNYILNNYLFFVKKKPSILLRNCYNEVGILIQCIDQFFKLAAELLVFLIIFLILAFLQTKFTFFIFLVFFTFGLIYFFFIKKRLTIWSNNKIKFSGKIIQLLQQTFDSVKFIKIKNLEKKTIKDYEKDVESFSKYTRLQMFINEIPRIFLELIGVGSILFMLFLLYEENKVDLSYLIPTLGLLAISAFRLLPCINRIISNAQSMLNSVASINAVYENLNQKKEFSEKINKINFTFKDKIELKNFSYKYPNSNKNIFNDTNLVITKNDFVCIAGESGVGKTTLADIILGLLPPTHGKIFIDDQELDKNNLSSWQSKIGFVPQSIILFNDTIKENIALINDETNFDQKAFRDAIKNAQLVDFINEKDQKENFIIDEKGKNLSVGQIQRIGIARALYFNPDILVFDEFTSALDEKNQDNLIEVIKNISKDKTIIVISHSQKILNAANKVIQIDKSKNIKILNN